MLARNAWEKRKLGEVATITMGQSPDSKNYTLNPQDHILVQGNADIKNGWVEPRVWTTQITKIAKKGSVLLSVRAPVGEVSKTAFDVVLGRGVASVGQTDFLYQYLITLKINGFWLRYSTGSTFDSINSADIKDAIIFLPEKNEQSRIAKTLNCIDNLIAATQRRIDDLEQVEKTLLQHLFDQSWRFNVYSDPWVKSKVANMAKENFGGGTPSTKKRSFWTGSLPWIQSSDLDKSNKYTVIPKKFISSAALKSSAAKKVPSNSIAVVTRVGVGKLAFINYDYATSQDFLSFSFLNWSAFFSVNLLTRVMEQMSNEGQGTSIKGVTKSELLAKSVLIPTSLEEQISIGNLLKSFDDLIKSTSNRLSKLELLKTSLLKNLFV
ncbi:restriction endonuclease subunit S [Lacticaseibacillus paracasei]|uniref:restriction endonuclease subunit S n=3 Tax=Lacticaseibacillus paracasei TaxID=1597 RepID=UPI001CDD1AA5|nr:restriction endonuclease subunit S [Lacticaseibacillus paracasei]MDB7793365.1 restriction endonuclease subunit S [Lacticaseibacillus paracasei]MDH7450566.1 restriction endonuclease subunit S [Lacticaseibacillus paracasei subsp. paracasei]